MFANDALLDDLSALETLEDFHSRFQTEQDCAEVLYRMKWPSGYCCPRCDHRFAYVISGRRLPLFQCATCKHQSSLLEGTVMERSRTDLRKWFLAIWFISDTVRTKNAVQLQNILNVTYKTAWLMLSKLRNVLSSENQQIRLENVVHISTGSYGRPYNPTIFRHRQEHPVLIGVATNEAGEPQHIQIKQLQKEFLRNRRPTLAGREVFTKQHVKPDTEEIHFTLGRFKERKSPITFRFIEEVSRWMNRVFKGIGSKHLQTYLDEFCFRYHLQFIKKPIFPTLIRLCITPSA